jgi:hypothetical protein
VASCIRAVDSFEEEIRRRADITFSAIVNGVNRSATVVGQWANLDFRQAFSCEPLDTDQGGSGQIIGKGRSHARTDEVATAAFVGSAALHRCRARAFRGAQREGEHISGAQRECAHISGVQRAGK